MKVIIPLAGAGTKLRPFTHTQPKSLIPLAGKPIIGHILDALIEKGFDDFVFVIGYLGNKIRHYIRTAYPNITKNFVQQENREGLGHAIWTTKKVMRGEEEMLIVLGDLIFDSDLTELINSQHSILASALVDDPREFGVVETNKKEEIIRAIEKPRIPKSNRAIVGIYKVKEVQLLFKCLDQIIATGIKTAGEYQLTDAIQLMIEQGVVFKTCRVDNWFDCGRTDVLLETNKLLLKRNGNDISQVEKEDNLVIVPPVHIGEACEISNSIIGPYVTIGSQTRISNSIINNSIIGDHSLLQDVVLNASIIGNDSAIKGYGKTLNIGDNTVIDLRPE